MCIVVSFGSLFSVAAVCKFLSFTNALRIKSVLTN